MSAGSLAGSGLCPELVEALEGRLGIKKLLPIQQKTFSALCGGRNRHFDLRICSPTGSGKTLAYALPVLQEAYRCQRAQLQCIAILPTRDLAMQVHSVFSSLVDASRTPSVSVGLCCGLASLEEERAQFQPSRSRGHRGQLSCSAPEVGVEEGGVSILVATPGRLKSHLERRHLRLSHLKFLVLDEMDRLLQQSYHDCIPFLLEEFEASRRLKERNESRGMEGTSGRTPGEEAEASNPFFLQPKYKCPAPRLVRLSVSATIGGDSNKTAKIQEEFVRTVSGFDASAGRLPTDKYELPENLAEFRVVCAKERKPYTLLDLLKKVEKQRAVCFTNSTEASHLVTALIRKTKSVDWTCEAYNSRRTPVERLEALRRFKRGEVDLLVASDALSRGIDMPAVKLVINYDAPSSTKNYVHRVGRTARVGEKGTAITILGGKDDVGAFKKLLRKLGPSHTFPSLLPQKP